MEFQQKIGVAITSVLTLLTVFSFPISEYPMFIWLLAMGMIGGDAVTTSLFRYFDEEEQEGITRDLCGAQPSLSCMLFTRIPIVISSAILYFAWGKSEFIISYGSGTVAPELIPLMLAIGGLFAVFWNIYGFIK